MFQKKHRPTPRDIPDLPTGTVIRTDKDHFYIKDKKKFRINSSRILDSWAFDRVVYVTEACAGRYKTMGKLGFREGTVIKDMGTREVFLISGNARRKIVSPDTLTYLNIEDILLVSSEEANIHKLGEEV